MFTGVPATVTFPAGLTGPESGPVPGVFRVQPLADDGCYAYRIACSSEDLDTPSVMESTLRIGLIF